MRVLRTEDQVKQYFLDFRSEYFTIEENEKYAQSLDCAIAVYIYCRKHQINCDKTDKRIEEAVTEDDKFWKTCVEEASKDYQVVNPDLATNLFMIRRKAVTIGINALVDAFSEGY